MLNLSDLYTALDIERKWTRSYCLLFMSLAPFLPFFFIDVRGKSESQNQRKREREREREKERKKKQEMPGKEKKKQGQITCVMIDRTSFMNVS